MVRQGEKSRTPGTVGLIAGGVELNDPSPLDAGFREALEETEIKRDHIIFVRGRNDPRPHVAPIIGPDKIHMGLVFDMTYSGPRVPLAGWDIRGDKIDRVEIFTWQQILHLLDNPDQIYRPEFNTPQFIRWLLLNHGGNPQRTKTVDAWFQNRNIEGLRRRQDSNITDRSTLLSKWEYIPPYENWLTLPQLFGNPQKTNFARTRSKWVRK